MTPYQISSEIYGGFYYPGITLRFRIIITPRRSRDPQTRESKNRKKKKS